MAASVATTRTSGWNAGGVAGNVNLTAFAASGGNCIVVCVRDDPGGSYTITDTASNTYTQRSAQTSGSIGLQMFVAQNISGHGSNVINVARTTGNLTSYAIGAIELSGIDTTAAYDTDTFGQASGTSVTSGSFNTANANSYVIACTQISALSSTWTPDTGYSNILQDGSAVIMVQARSFTSVQTGITVTATANQSNVMMIGVVVLKEAAGGGGSAFPHYYYQQLRG